MNQQFYIKFCFKLNKTTTNTHEILVQVYGQDSVSGKHVYEWSIRFCAGKKSVGDKPRVQDLAPTDFFFVPSSKSDLEGFTVVCRRQRDSGSCDSYFKYGSKKGLF